MSTGKFFSGDILVVGIILTAEGAETAEVKTFFIR